MDLNDFDTYRIADANLLADLAGEYEHGKDSVLLGWVECQANNFRG